MKNKNLLVSALAVTFLTSSLAGATAASPFEGGYAGFRLGGSSLKANVKPTVAGVNFEQNGGAHGIAGDLVGGYLFAVAPDFHLGGEVTLGFNSAKHEEKAAGISGHTKKSYSLNIMGVAGYQINPNLLGLVKLGYTHSEFKHKETVANAKETKKKKGGFVVEVEGKMPISDCMFLSLGMGYKPAVEAAKDVGVVAANKYKVKVSESYYFAGLTYKLS